MGSEVTARCRCGVEVSILIGGGMLNFQTTCYFPCSCAGCSSVVQVNLLAKRLRCPSCGSSKVTPFDDPSLSRRTRGGMVTSWNSEKVGRDLTLTDKPYRCPRCGELALRFEESGLLWD